MKKSAKKQLTAAILAGLTLAVAAPAMAAANPFSDVPAKHWAYDSVSKLAAAGIVDGYGDGTFKGDKTMTRYEMAQIVAKAMAHEDRANAEQKAMIEKLAQEFQDELDNLGVRVDKLEKKIGNITWTGQVREWYEWTNEPQGGMIGGDDNTSLRTRILLWTSAPLTDELTFKGRFYAESGWGTTYNQSAPYNAGVGTGANVNMDQAYLLYQHGNTVATLGRQGITLGKGLVYNMGPNNDGVTITVGDKVKLTGAAFRSWAAEYPLGFSGVNPNIYAANVAWQANEDLDITGVYAKNRKNNGVDFVKTWSLGFTYKGIDNIAITGEYGENNSVYAKAMNNGDGAKAWVAQIKYRGAEWDKPHSYGIWVGYRKAEDGFTGITGDPLWETPATISPMNDVKGAEYGFDYTVFKNGIFSFNYLDLETEDGVWDQKGLVTQLRYMF